MSGCNAVREQRGPRVIGGKETVVRHEFCERAGKMGVDVTAMGCSSAR